jgi:hypothetical protein
MPDIDYIRGEIERMRVQVGRQRNEILQLQRAHTDRVSRCTAPENARQDRRPLFRKGQIEVSSARTNEG